MPTYTFQCEKCEKVEDVYRSINDRNNAPECHGPMKRVIMPPKLQPILGGADFPGYECPVSGQYVTSRRQRRELMARHDMVETG